MNITHGSPFPTKEQEFLLKAALFKNKELFDAWNMWKQMVDLGGYMDQGSFRLLPLLYKNLLANAIKDPIMGKLKGVYRKAWYNNQKLLYNAGNIILFFQKSGIETLLLKGAALSKLFYKDTGVRPMKDIDILVPFSKARMTIDILKKTGWEPEFEAYIEYNLRYGRSMQFTNDSGFELDLHWHPFFESHRDTAEKYFWDEAVPLQISDASTLALCATDTILHTIVHGLSWNPEPPIRWVADSYVILNNPEIQINWNRLLSQIRKYKIVLQFKNAFFYLKNTFNLPIPDYVINEIKDMPIRLAERMVYRYSIINHDEIPNTLYGKFYQLFVIYLRQTNKIGLLGQIFGFLSYLRFRIKGKNYFRILRYYMSKTVFKKK